MVLQILNENTEEPARVKKPAFNLCVNLKMNIDLAFALANFVLDNDCTNPAILAIAHQIVGNEPVKNK